MIGLLLPSIEDKGDKAWAVANPPTNYTLQTTPYNGSEQWYCEDVTHTTDKACNVTGLFASISTLANLTSASSLAIVGTLTGGAASTGFTIQLSNVTYTGSFPIGNLPSCYSAGLVPVSCGGNGTASPGIQAGVGIAVTGSWPTQTVKGVAGAVQLSFPGNPTGTSSSSLVMMGLGSTLTITPTKTGVVLLAIGGTWSDSSANTCSFQLRYGTGTAPANGAATTGTQASQTISPSTYGASNAQGAFQLIGAITSGSVSTAYWYDLAAEANGGSGTCSPVSLTGVAIEQ